MEGKKNNGNLISSQEEDINSSKNENCEKKYDNFINRHREYLKKKHSNDNNFSIDLIIPGFILFISSFLLFLEASLNTFLSMAKGTTFSKKICNLIFQWFLNLEEISFGLFGQMKNSISDDNQILLSEKMDESYNKLGKLYKRLEEFFYNENKNIMESIINDIDNSDI